MKSLALVGIFLLAALPKFAAAEVVDSAPGGFTVKTTLEIQAPPEVYRKFLRVSEWWSSEHTFSGDARNLSIEEKPLGCWCEKLPNGGAARHMEVITLMPGKLLVLAGGLGPLQKMAVYAVMTVQLTPSSGGTKLAATYAVNGYFAQGHD
ncbi:MAG: hypothetical protein WB992_01835, partial [Bryobacteraceae bacterium]